MHIKKKKQKKIKGKTEAQVTEIFYGAGQSVANASVAVSN